jgi:2-isopropylmalate synthase
VQAKLHSYEERAMGQGADATAVTFAEVVTDSVPGTVFGVGMHANIVTASVLAVISGLNRIYAKLPEQEKEAFFRQQEQVSV